MYTKEELLANLETTIVGRKIFVFETIDSTNSCARTLGDTGTEEGVVVLSDFQTHGRGRLGRSWIAEPGSNLLFSVLLRPQISIDKAGLLTFFASVAVARAIERQIDTPIECKWPNDLLLHGKKFCGILLENSFQQSELAYAVIGIGLNVNQANYLPEVALRATSLAREAGSPLDRKEVFQNILRELDRLYAGVQKGEWSVVVDEWTRRCSMFGKSVTVQEHDSFLSGTALRLHHDGGLILETKQGTRTVYAGDVTLLS